MATGFCSKQYMPKIGLPERLTQAATPDVSCPTRVYRFAKPLRKSGHSGTVIVLVVVLAVTLKGMQAATHLALTQQPAAWSRC